MCTADLEVDAFLKRELQALLPAAGWLSEETADHPERLGKGLCWLVDPIDGTRDFIRGRPGWAVSVALISDGKPLIGMLVAPGARRDSGAPRAGQGAWRNGERLRGERRAPSCPARAFRPIRCRAEDRDLTMVDKPNSIALRVAMVAAGEADLVATLRWGYEWDVAAAALIAREAGAAVTDAFGQALAYNKRDPRAFGLLVSAPAIHRPRSSGWPSGRRRTLSDGMIAPSSSVSAAQTLLAADPMMAPFPWYRPRHPRRADPAQRRLLDVRAGDRLGAHRAAQAGRRAGQRRREDRARAGRRSRASSSPPCRSASPCVAVIAGAFSGATLGGPVARAPGRARRAGALRRRARASRW